MTNFWQALENLGGTAMESAVIQELERRLYYDKNGDVITYTTEDLDGEYIVVDQSTYQQARTDLKIKDEKIIRITRGSSWKIKPNKIKSIPIHPKDVSIVVNSKYENPSYWQVVTTHEAE
jgi:hypothetical protein|tara:strand:+ start:137 stop:496 length:360 start_codon:yes stop_codon:yes gene_type:complete